MLKQAKNNFGALLILGFLSLGGCNTGGIRLVDTVPTTPTGVRAVVGNGQVTLLWDQSPAVDYNLYISSAEGRILRRGVTPPFVLSGFTNGIAYSFLITASNIAGESAPFMLTATPTGFAAPTGVRVEPNNEQLTLYWDSVPNATSYKLYLSFANEQKVYEGITSPFVLSGLINETTYYFALTAVRGVEEGPSSIQIQGTPTTRPTNLRAIAGNRQVTLSWNLVSGATSYNLYMASVPGVRKDNHTLLTGGMKHPGGTSPYLHTGLSPGTTYYFVVTAVHPAGESAESIEVAATTLSDQLVANAQDGNRQVTVSWNPVVGADSYNLYRASASGVNKNNYSTLPNGMKHTGVISPYRYKELTNGTTYYFVITAVGGGVEGPESNEVMGKAREGFFSPTGSMAIPRAQHTATLLQDGRVLIAGGEIDMREPNSTLTNSAEIYDPHTGKFTLTGSMSTARSDHTATLLPNGKVLIAGGVKIDENNAEVTLGSAELYDPMTGTFTVTGAMKAPRVDFTATLLSNGKVFVAGGFEINQVLTSAELYDPTTGTFTLTGSMTQRHAGHTDTLLNDGRVLITGGYSSVNLVTSGSDLYSPVLGTSTVTASMTTNRFEHIAELLPNGDVLIAGGVSKSFLSEAELYKNGAMRTTGVMIMPRIAPTGTLLPNEMVLIAGGGDGYYYGPNTTVPSLSTAELYDYITETFVPTGGMGVERVGHTATLLKNGEVLIVGGENGYSPPFNSAERYTP